MTVRIAVRWPDPAPFASRGGRPIRILAVSDQRESTLDHQVNRAQLGPIDLVVGCGDLGADDLCFVADAFHAPLIYVRGNHDRGMRWGLGASHLPTPLQGSTRAELGLRIVGLGWPGIERSRGHARRDEAAAWRDCLLIALRSIAGRRFGQQAARTIVVSHAAPAGIGDGPDPYHRGFRAYRWLLDRFRPPLWLHGHTTLASVGRRRIDRDGSAVVNVTGAVLVELLPPHGLRSTGTPEGEPGGRLEVGSRVEYRPPVDRATASLIGDQAMRVSSR